MIKDKLEYLSAIKKLNKWTEAYDNGYPEVSDKEWDDLYFEVKEFEKNNTAAKDSPSQTISYQVVNSLKKVTHSHPMLSLDKTKDINNLKSFIGNHDYILMAKMDGLTCSLTYQNGQLILAETRGNGIVGEDITHNANVISSIPKSIPALAKYGEVVIDGEIICTYSNFESFSTEYKNPRNFAAGSIRLLDSQECEKRKLTFVAWDVIKGLDEKKLSEKLGFLNIATTFKVVPFLTNNNTEKLEEDINYLKRQCENFYSYPIDGMVVKYNKIDEYNAAGRTDHHFKGGLAYKFYDETYETEVKDIEWTMGRTGQLTPVLIYNDIDIDGTICNRASLHNISIMTQLMGGAYPGQRVFIYRANQIIPQVESAQINNPNKVPLIQIPTKCPYCGEPTEIKQENESKVLYCTNPNCSGKLINKLDHFCGKKGLDIKGISKATLEKLIDWNWVSCFKDIYRLQEHKKEWSIKEGFGEKSVQNILDSIEKSRNNDLWRVIAAAGIPNVGSVAAKQLANYFKTYAKFRSAVEEDFDFTELPDFGEVTAETLLNFDYTEIDDVVFYAIHCNPVEEQSSNALEGISFCITGKLNNFKNRNELKEKISSLGGKVTDSVSSKTNYLINNDIESNSSKNKAAKALHIPIITEEDFLDMIETTI